MLIRNILGTVVAALLLAGCYQFSPLWHATAEGCQACVVQALQDGENINQLEWTGLAPLHVAAEIGRPSMIALLIARGADPNLMSKPGYEGWPATPLHYALRNGNNIAAKILIKGGARNLEDARGQTPLQLAKQKRYTEVIALLVDSGANPAEIGESSLHIAAASGDVASVKRLLAAGADPNTANKSHETPLYAAAANGEVDTVRILLEAGADPNAANKDKRTPLHAAAANNKVDVIRTLLEAGAEVDARAADGSTPLHLTAFAPFAEVAEVLLQAGANVQARRVDGETPMSLAARLSPQVKGDVPALHKLAASGHWSGNQYLLTLGADPDSRLADGRTALHIAAQFGNVPIVEMYIAAGADVAAVADDGSTPLHVAASSADVSNVYLQQRLFNALIGEGVSINQPRATDGATPLMLAVRGERSSTIDYFLKHGADPDLQDSDGRTALHYAAAAENLSLAQQLLDVGADASISDYQGRMAHVLLTAIIERKRQEALVAARAEAKRKRAEQRRIAEDERREREDLAALAGFVTAVTAAAAASAAGMDVDTGARAAADLGLAVHDATTGDTESAVARLDAALSGFNRGLSTQQSSHQQGAAQAGNRSGAAGGSGGKGAASEPTYPLVGKYKTRQRTHYNDVVRYETLEILNNGTAKEVWVTDMTNSPIREQALGEYADCPVERLVFNLKYEKLKENSYRFTCLNKIEEYCGETGPRNCFEGTFTITLKKDGIDKNGLMYYR